MDSPPTFIVDLNSVGRVGAEEGCIPTLREHTTDFPLLPILEVGDRALALCEEDIIVDCVVARVDGRQIDLRPDWDRQWPATVNYMSDDGWTASGQFTGAPTVNGKPMNRVPLYVR